MDVFENQYFALAYFAIFGMAIKRRRRLWQRRELTDAEKVLKDQIYAAESIVFPAFCDQQLLT